MLTNLKAWLHDRKVEKATRALHRAIGKFPSRHSAMFEIQSIITHQSTDEELTEFFEWLNKWHFWTKRAK